LCKILTRPILTCGSVAEFKYYNRLVRMEMMDPFPLNRGKKNGCSLLWIESEMRTMHTRFIKLGFTCDVKARSKRKLKIFAFDSRFYARTKQYLMNSRFCTNSGIIYISPTISKETLFQIGELLRTLRIMVGYLKDRCWQQRH
jgi:hypothetical protein